MKIDINELNTYLVEFISHNLNNCATVVFQSNIPIIISSNTHVLPVVAQLADNRLHVVRIPRTTKRDWYYYDGNFGYLSRFPEYVFVYFTDATQIAYDDYIVGFLVLRTDIKKSTFNWTMCKEQIQRYFEERYLSSVVYTVGIAHKYAAINKDTFVHPVFALERVAGIPGYTLHIDTGRFTLRKWYTRQLFFRSFSGIRNSDFRDFLYITFPDYIEWLKSSRKCYLTGFLVHKDYVFGESKLV